MAVLRFLRSVGRWQSRLSVADMDLMEIKPWCQLLSSENFHVWGSREGMEFLGAPLMRQTAMTAVRGTRSYIGGGTPTLQPGMHIRSIHSSNLGSRILLSLTPEQAFILAVISDYKLVVNHMERKKEKSNETGEFHIGPFQFRLITLFSKPPEPPMYNELFESLIGTQNQAFHACFDQAEQDRILKACENLENKAFLHAHSLDYSTIHRLVKAVYENKDYIIAHYRIVYRSK